MRHTLRRHERPLSAVEAPREGEGATVISLATRNAMPAVTQRKPGAETLGLFAGVAVVGLLGALTLWSLSGSQKARPPAAAATLQPAPAPAAPPRQTAPAAPPQAITLPGQTPFAPASQPQAGAAPAGNRFSTPTVVFDASALPAPAVPPALGAGAPGATAGSNDDFAARIGGVGGATTVATAGINPQTTVTQGTLIAAVLETAIDTDVPGYVRAVVSSDVRGFDGTRVMIPRSSRLIGQYKSGLQAGQRRAYIVWTRVIRPDGVSVNIASPAISFGGETGLDGEVNNHFFERFGSAMLLSVVGGLSAIGNASAVIVGGQAQSAAAAAVGQGGQIGPTVRVRQGEPIRVFTARDLDFSKVVTR